MKRNSCKYVNFYFSAALTLIFMCSSSVNGQLKDENFFIKWGSWAILQAIPSPTLLEDRDENVSKIRFALEWQVIPLSYSFNTNRYVSNFNFLHIKPNKRFSGSLETFFEPVFVPGGFNHNSLEKFMYKTGLRVVIPVFHKGEYLSFSLGAGYYSQKSVLEHYEGVTYEAGVYSFYGMMGLKFSYNQKALSRYSLSLYIKYY